MQRSDVRESVRLLRSAPQFTLGDAAARLGEPAAGLVAHLESLAGRGRCATAAAAAALSERGRDSGRSVAGFAWDTLAANQPQITTRTRRSFPVPTAHWACPPSAVRAASAETGTRVDVLAAAGFAGAAGWTGREAWRWAAPRRVRATAVRDDALNDVATLAACLSRLRRCWVLSPTASGWSLTRRWQPTVLARRRRWLGCRQWPL